jgi:hypothetical protein
VSHTEKEHTMRVFAAVASVAIGTRLAVALGGIAFWLLLPWMLCGFVAPWRRIAGSS